MDWWAWLLIGILIGIVVAGTGTTLWFVYFMYKSFGGG